MWNFFEQPWTLVGAAILVLFGVLTFRSVWDEKRRWWQWLLPLGVVALAFGLDYVVATDREKIHSVVRAGIEAAEQEDCVAIARLIAEDYEDSYHNSKRALLARCQSRLEPPAVEKIRRIDMLLEISERTAVATFTMWVSFEEHSYWARNYKPNALVKMQFYLQKQPDGTWLVNRAEVKEVDKMAVHWGVARATPDRLGLREGLPSGSG